MHTHVHRLCVFLQHSLWCLRTTIQCWSVSLPLRHFESAWPPFFSVHVSLITWWGFWQGRSMLSSLSLGSGFVTLEVWPLTRVMGPCSQVYVLLMRSLGNSLSSVSYNVPWKVWIWRLNCLLSLGLVTIKYVCISWAPAVCWLWFLLLRRVGEKDDSCPEETHIRAGITWKGN